MVASEIAGELDCQVNWSGGEHGILAERSLINRAASIGSVYKYTITPEAKSAYFDDLGTGDLNVSNSDEGG